MMMEVLLQVDHFYRLIRYESQKVYLVEFMKKMQLRELRRGQVLYKEGVVNEGLYVILRGKVSLWQTKSQGEINNEIAIITKLSKYAKVSNPSDQMKEKIDHAQFRLNFLRNKEDDDLFRKQKDPFFLTENICALKRIRSVGEGGKNLISTWNIQIICRLVERGVRGERWKDGTRDNGDERLSHAIHYPSRVS